MWRHHDGEWHGWGLLENGGFNFLVAMLKGAKGVFFGTKGEGTIVGSCIIIEKVLIGTISKDFVPFGGSKVGQGGGVGHYRGKPIIEYNMELGG